MKVLYLVTGIRPPSASGSEFIPNLIYEICKEGVDSTIISPIYIQTQKNMLSWASEVEKKYKIRLILIDMPTFIKKRFLLHIIITPAITTIAVIKILLREKFDIIHEFTSTPVITFRSLIYLFFKTPSIFTLSVLNKTILGKLFWFKVFNFGSAYVIPSREIIKKLISSGIKKDKIFYVLPGIKVTNFKQNITKLKAREKLGLPQNLTVFTYFGPLTKEKGVLDILAASKILPTDVLKGVCITLYSYYLTGYTKYKNMAIKIREEGNQNLKLYEKYVEIPLLLAASDYVIYPQQTGHGTTIPPISVLETLASRKPIITTNIVGIRELINKNNGMLIPPSDPKALAKAISEAYFEKVNLKNINSLESFNLSYVSEQMLSIYNKLYEK